MKKLIILIVLIVLVLVGIFYFKIKVVKCDNGIFIGKKANYTNVIEFRGIPFAKKPIGDLRWKAPVEADKSNKINFAFKYDTIALQTDFDEEIYDKSEDCLRLNVWTTDLKTKNKPVMIYFHGGSYGWEGSVFSLYDGQYFVNEYRDIVLVTVDYRVNLMGFIDFSDVPGGENFKDAPYLGILDCIMALKWVNNNIEAFGGNPDNITIFGESAGGGIVSSLLTIKEAQNLFQRAIAQSGTLNLTSDRKGFKKYGQTKEFMKAAGAKNMDDLMNLTDKQILDAMNKGTSKVGREGVSGVANLNNFPLRGNDSIIPEQPYKAIENGMSKDVDLMIGTTTDEMRYWIPIMQMNFSEKENFALFDTFIAEKAEIGNNDIKNKYFSIINTDNDKYSREYKDIWKNTELANDIWFRMPSIKTAEAHIKANGKGKTYLYSFGKKANHKAWWGAAHAVELPYVFYNLKNKEYGDVDKNLAKHISNAWANFARTGNPSTDFAKWTQYDLKDRNTMFIDNDCSMKMVKDYKGEQRKLLNKIW